MKHNETYMEGGNPLTIAMVVRKDINICGVFFRLTVISIVLSAPACLIFQRCITDFDMCCCLSPSVWTNLRSSQLKTHQILPTLQIRANLPEMPVPHRLRHQTLHIFQIANFIAFHYKVSSGTLLPLCWMGWTWRSACMFVTWQLTHW